MNAKPVFNREHIKQFRFKQLFNELGWDLPTQQQPFSVVIDDYTWLLDVVAHKKGVQILHCQPGIDGQLPDYSTRQKIERKITPDVREHLIVFTDSAQSAQIWQWVTREPGKTAQYREVNFRKGDAPELLVQKLSRLQFTLDEEELLTVFGVTQRLDDAAPREKVTKKFYADFEKQRKLFADFIEGIPATSEDQRWYTAVLIDRLMFLWFLQEKSFLNGKKDYLQARLTKHLNAQPTVSFYKSFLSPLFFRGFAEERTPSNSAGIAAEFGSVPYLNGGLFAQHQLEQRYGEALDVADTAFIKLFAFFDEWEWHLDERPLKSGKEINPDVLGYIFEKFVNQKQMGAYYTKEDITDYIGKNTIIPCLLAKVRAEHPKAFDDLAWPLLQQSGDSYIYPAMLKGVDVAYPSEIANGLDTVAPDLLTRRKPWNKRADDEVSLPTEIWREAIARHKRTREIRSKLIAGEIKEVGELITYNLNIRQFAQDLIESCTDVALLKSFWFALAGRLPRKSNEKFRHGMSVLDPTCGSGAFLFAALNILKPLYDATLHTFQAVRSDALITGEKHHPEKWLEVDEILARFAATNTDRAQDYAVIKHIIVNNLYGVDIEEQATEIAKLRLFLKLVALLEPGDNIEPLPDIDFNIRHGNTLVGYATAEETEKAVLGVGSDGQERTGNLFGDDPWSKIKLDLVVVEEKYNNFQIQQVQLGGHVSSEDKKELTKALEVLEETLNEHLAKDYGVDPTKVKKYESWKTSHQPFHWLVDFYPLMANGGFDVVIGNPPFVESTPKNVEYRIIKSVIGNTFECGNLYAYITERSTTLIRKNGAFAFITPAAVVCTPRMSPVAKLLNQKFDIVAFSLWDERPSKLFDGVDQQLAITICLPKTNQQSTSIFITNMRHWLSAERNNLFDQVNFVKTGLSDKVAGVFPKVSSDLEVSLLDKFKIKRPLPLPDSEKQGKLFYKNAGGRYWRLVKSFPSYFSSSAGANLSSTEKIRFVPLADVYFLVACFSSNLFYWYWRVASNCRHLTDREFEAFSIMHISKVIEKKEILSELANKYEVNLSKTAVRLEINNKRSGVIHQDSFRIGQSKSILDEIDNELKDALLLTDEELDFVINYDIKYRMGQGMEDNDN